MQSSQLLSDLQKMVQDHMKRVQAFQRLDISQLNAKINAETWSILECIEHLNLYGDFYIPELQYRIQNAKHPAVAKFKSGWLGNRSAMDMLPKENMKTMTAFKSKNPVGSALNKEVLHRFLEQQQQMLTLLHQAQKVNLNRTKTKLTLPLLRFKLGDTLRFIIYHNERHIVQAMNLKEAMG